MVAVFDVLLISIFVVLNDKQNVMSINLIFTSVLNIL